jgi:hypothetical protein
VLGAGDSLDFASTLPHVLRTLRRVNFVGIRIAHHSSH